MRAIDVNGYDDRNVVGDGRGAGRGVAIPSVTSGVTWVSRGEARVSSSRTAPMIGSPAVGRAGWPARVSRANCVQGGLFGLGGIGRKSLQNMVGATGIEPVTPTMSR